MLGSVRQRVSTRWDRTTIRARVAILAIAFTLPALATLAYVHLSAVSQTFTAVAKGQSLTSTKQLSSAFENAGPMVVNFVPFTEKGLDGIVVFDPRGDIVAAGGGLADEMRGLTSEARGVGSRNAASQFFRSPGGEPSPTLSPWPSRGTFQVTIVPHGEGALAAAYHVDWATGAIRSEARAFVTRMLIGAALIAISLTLLLTGMVARPLARLAAEVRQLGQGNLVTRLSRQRAPELRQLGADISKMRDDLIVAMRESSTDPLTGIPNHRAFHEAIDAAIEGSRSSGKPLALIAIDLDNLKMINDLFGHVAGDRILEAVAAEIAAVCRESDVCARVGGDEFAVVCPGVDASGAARIAERIVRAVGLLSPQVVLGRAVGPAALTVSVSAGVCDLPRLATTKDELIRNADAAMYAGKISGGCVNVFLDDRRITSPDSDEGDRMAATVRALAMAVDAKDSGTRSHCETVARYTGLIASGLGLEPRHVAELKRAALLHDIGKIGTPDAILSKPSKLTEAERAVIEEHPVLGYRIIRSGGLPEKEARWVLHHHEHVNGSGYPNGLRGDDIPVESRILLVADAFEAMTSDRPYRSAMPTADAIAELRRCAGTQFDPDVVEALIATLPTEAPVAPAGVALAIS